MLCFFKKKKQAVAPMVDYYRRAAHKALNDLPPHEYTWGVNTIHGTFTISHNDTGIAKKVCELSDLDFWVQILTAIEQLEEAVEMQTHKMVTIK